MIPARQVVLALLFVWLAAIAQGRLAHAVRLGSAQPDFILILLGSSASLLGVQRGMLLGFWAGLLTAVMMPTTFGTYLTSRLLAGAFAGTLQRSLIRDSPIVPPLVVLAATLAAEAIYILMAPAVVFPHLRHWLWRVGGETIYNILLSFPLYFLLRLCGIGRLSADPFARLS